MCMIPPIGSTLSFNHIIIGEIHIFMKLQIVSSWQLWLTEQRKSLVVRTIIWAGEYILELSGADCECDVISLCFPFCQKEMYSLCRFLIALMLSGEGKNRLVQPCKNEPTILQQWDKAYLRKELLHICFHSNDVSLHPVEKSKIHSDTSYNYRK